MTEAYEQTPEGDDPESVKDMQVAVASLIAGILYLEKYLEAGGTENIEIPMVHNPEVEGNRERLQDLARHLSGSLLEWCHMPEEIRSNITTMIDGRVMAQLLIDKANKQGKKPLDFLLEESKNNEGCKDDGELYNDKDEEDLKWMDEHPRFRKN